MPWAPEGAQGIDPQQVGLRPPTLGLRPRADPVRREPRPLAGCAHPSASEFACLALPPIPAQRPTVAPTTAPRPQEG